MLELWIRFARRLLKLPEGDADVAAGDDAHTEVWNPGAGYRRYRLLSFWISGAVSVLGVAGAMVALYVAERQGELSAMDPQVMPWVFAGCGLLLLWLGGVFAFKYATVHLELDMLRYTLTDRVLRLRRGAMNVQEVTLSFANIQNVKYQQGPLQRIFGIGDLVVETAGGGGGATEQAGGAGLGAHHQGLIQGVSEPEKLRETILARVRAVKGAGLGDHADDHATAGASLGTSLGTIDSAEGRALLREIRDGLAAVGRHVG